MNSPTIAALKWGWSWIVPGTYVSKYTDLFVYDPVSQTGALYASDGQGNLTVRNSYSGWSPFLVGTIAPLGPRFRSENY